ncbi:MAG: hypothetical protein GY930_10375 [bacterium]|nr:hypothetical protein [bacterium]
MMYDQDKVDEAVLALLTLTSHQSDGVTRAWKGQAWEVMDRLFEKGWIADPKGKAKSVILTDKGEALSQELFSALFGR